MTEQETQTAEATEATETLPQGDEPVQDEYSEAMSNAYDRAMARIEEDRDPSKAEAEKPKEAEPVEADEKPDEAKDAKDAKAEDAKDEEGAEGDDPDTEDEGDAKDAPPTDLPAKLKKVWASLPEDARAAMQEHTRKINDKAAKAGQEVRSYQGVKPVHDALVEMAREIPELADKSIPDIVAEVKQLAQISAAMNKDPLQAVVGVIRQHNLGPALAQMFAGQNPQAEAQTAHTMRQMQQQIEKLQGQLQQYSDPEYIQQNMTTAQTLGVVNEFQQSAERWADVEDIMPNIIQRVMADKPDLPPGEVLDTAYKRALRIFDADDETGAAPATDRDRVEAAKKATKINVNGSGSGNGRQLTYEDQVMAAYDRAMRA